MKYTRDRLYMLPGDNYEFRMYKQISQGSLNALLHRINNNTSAIEENKIVELFKHFELTGLDLSAMTTTGTRNLTEMFQETFHEGLLDLSFMDTSSVKYMKYTFRHSRTDVVYVLKWNTSNVEYMTGMFEGCETSFLDLSSFRTSKVRNMSYMFKDARIPSLEISTFDTSNVYNMEYMFHRISTHTLSRAHFNFKSVGAMHSILDDLQGVVRIVLPHESRVPREFQAVFLKAAGSVFYSIVK